MKHLTDDLDERLESPAQVAVRNAVKALPEDNLSLAWRSGLNEQLLQVAEKQRRRRRAWFFLKPAVGLAAACGLAAVVLMHSFTPAVRMKTSKSSDLSAALVSFHQDASMSVDVSGTSINPIEATNDRSEPSATSADWSEYDVESL